MSPTQRGRLAVDEAVESRREFFVPDSPASTNASTSNHRFAFTCARQRSSPHSHKVRQRLTELGLDFTARHVPADPDARNEMTQRPGTSEIRVLVTDAGEILKGEEEIMPWLDASTSAATRSSIGKRHATKSRSSPHKLPACACFSCVTRRPRPASRTISAR